MWSSIPAFERYGAIPEATAALAAERIKAGGYRAAVFPTSALGSDLSPRVAAKLGVGLVTDVTSVQLQGDTVVVKHPVNIGKVTATVNIMSTPALVAVRANTFTPGQSSREPGEAVETVRSRLAKSCGVARGCERGEAWWRCEA